MRKELILILMLMVIPIVGAFSKDITPDEIIAGDTKAINESGDPVYWYNKGIALLDLSMYNESIEAFDKYIELDPQSASAWFNKGRALSLQGKYDEAIKAYDAALKIDRNATYALDNKDTALKALGRTSYAKAAFHASQTTTNDKGNKDLHSYKAGNPGINEFIMNWTDNKQYTTIENEVSDETLNGYGGLRTHYFIRCITNDNEWSLQSNIWWHPGNKRPQNATLDNYPKGWIKPENLQGRVAISIQGKPGVMVKAPVEKIYEGSNQPPNNYPGALVARYFLDDNTEIQITAFNLTKWDESEFKSLLISLKITPPTGY